MSKENYESLLPEIEAISDGDTKVPNMPVDKYIQEAANLEVWCEPDISQLSAVGVAQTTFDSLPIKIGALRYAQSVWMKDRHSREEAQLQWDTEFLVALEMKNELEHGFRFGFRNRPDLLSKVHAIEEGTGNEDLVQDLSNLAVLGKANLALLTTIGITEAKLTAAESKSTEMSGLLALMTGERTENNSAKILRDKFYTLLKQSVDDIREAGKFVFWKDAKRLKGYKSAYFRDR
jgi:hypothetical protein